MLIIRMLKLCMLNPFTNLLFKSSLQTGQFPSKWKKANVAIFKQSDKQLQNYCPISLLSITGKVFEILLYNPMFKFFIRSDSIFQNQPGLNQGSSCLNQLLAITHEIYKSFDVCLDVRAVFLDISKVFDKVRRKCLLYKLKQNCISGNLLELFADDTILKL